MQTTVTVSPPTPDVLIQGPCLAAVGRAIPGAEDGVTIRAAGADPFPQLVKAIITASPLLSEVFGTGFELETGHEIFDPAILRRRFDRLGAAPLLETCERWLRRASTTDQDVAALFTAVKSAASLGMPVLRLPDPAAKDKAPKHKDADKKDGPGIDPTRPAPIAAPVAQARSAVAAGLELCSPPVASAFPKLRMGADDAFVAQFAILSAVVKHSASPTREAALTAASGLLADVNAHLAARTNEAAAAIAPAAEAIAGISSMLDNMGQARGTELTLINFKNPELALAGTNKALVSFVRRLEPSVDVLIANSLSSVESLDAFSTKFGTSPIVHGMIYASVAAETLDAARDIAAANPIRRGVADGHVTVFVGSATHTATGVRIGLAPAVLGARRRLDEAVDRPNFLRGYLNASAGRAGADLRAVSAIRDVSTADWDSNDALELEKAGLNTFGSHKGMLYARSALTRSSLGPYRFSDQVRFGDYIVALAREFFAGEAGWLHGDKNVRDYLRESFRTSVLARLADHEGTLFSLTVECGRDPTELVVGINAQQNPYINRIRFIDKRSVVEVVDRESKV